MCIFFFFLDLFFVFAILGGVATSLSLAVPLISAFVEDIFSLQSSIDSLKCR